MHFVIDTQSAWNEILFLIGRDFLFFRDDGHFLQQYNCTICFGLITGFKDNNIWWLSKI